MTSSKTQSRRYGSGFSLLELVIVLVILASAFALVSIRLAGPLRKARVEEVLQQWKLLDLHARRLNNEAELKLEIITRSSGQVLRLSSPQNERVIQQWYVSYPIRIRLESLSNSPLSFVSYVRCYGCQDYKILVQDGSLVRSECIAGASGESIPVPVGPQDFAG